MSENNDTDTDDEHADAQDAQDAQDDDLIEIHGMKGDPRTFDGGLMDEGVCVGSRSTSGDAPGVEVILTEHRVHVVHAETRESVGWVDIEHEYEPTDEDNSMREPTEPKDGAVEAARTEARALARGFMKGWTHRHEHGAHYPEMRRYAEKATEALDSALRVFDVDEAEQMMAVKFQLAGPESKYDFPTEWYEWLDDYDELEDFRLREHNDEEGYAIVEVRRIDVFDRR